MECKAKKCERKVLALGYCGRHYHQFKSHGRIFRSIYEKNKIIIKGEIAFIELYDRYGVVRALAKIDSEDVNKIGNHKLHLKISRDKKYYVGCNMPNGESVGLHNIILNKKFIDHINRNGLDNRKANLRPASHSQQNMNKGLQSNNKSGYRGIFYHKTKVDGKYYYYWEAWITVNKKRIYLGISKNKNKLINLRKEAEEKYFKDFRDGTIPTSKKNNRIKSK